MSGKNATADSQGAPLVSVIIATKNRPELLRTALASLCRQLLQDFEVLVVNDGGEDPGSVIREFSNRLRLTLLANERSLGVAASRNKALDAARGRFIAYLDDDDFYYEDHLQLLAVALLKSGASVAYSLANEALQKPENGEYVTVSRRVTWAHTFSPEKLCEGNYIPTLCIMHEKRCLDCTGKFKEHLDRHEDWDLWLRLSRYYDFLFFNLTTAEYTVREGAVSLSKDEEAMGRSRLHVRLIGDYLASFPRITELAARAGKARTLRRFSGKDVPLTIIMHIDRQTPDLARSLSAVGEAAPEGTEILFSVDGDPSVAAWINRSIDGNMTLVEHPEPVGRVLANNRAAALAQGRKLLFLGQELILDSACLAAMLEASAENRLVTPTFRSPGGILLRGGRMDAAGVLRHTAVEEPEGAPISAPVPVQCASAACLLMRREQFALLGGFALRFAPGGYEDADFCLRAARDHGISTVAVPQSALWTLPGKNAPHTPQALYGASEFASAWGEEPGWVPDREFWANPARSLRNDTRAEPLVYQKARIAG